MLLYLGHFLRDLDSWNAVNLNKLVDAAKRWLSLTRYKVRPNAKHVYFVALLLITVRCLCKIVQPIYNKVMPLS